MAGLAILFGNYSGTRPEQELLPHLSEARTAKFAVKHVKYNGHDRTPCLIIAVNSPSTASVGVTEVNQITRSPKGFATSAI
jgi:hypothetical protein